MKECERDAAHTEEVNHKASQKNSKQPRRRKPPTIEQRSNTAGRRTIPDFDCSFGICCHNRSRPMERINRIDHRIILNCADRMRSIEGATIKFLKQEVIKITEEATKAVLSKERAKWEIQNRVCTKENGRNESSIPKAVFVWSQQRQIEDSLAQMSLKEQIRWSERH